MKIKGEVKERFTIFNFVTEDQIWLDRSTFWSNKGSTDQKTPPAVVHRTKIKTNMKITIGTDGSKEN